MEDQAAGSNHESSGASASGGGNDSGDGLTFDELRRVSEARAARWAGGKDLGLAFAVLEMAGEAGEACNALKKLMRADAGIAGGRPDVQELVDEVADVVICADLVMQRLGLDLGAAVASKFNATSAKHGFPERLEGKACPPRAAAADRKQPTDTASD